MTIDTETLTKVRAEANEAIVRGKWKSVLTGPYGDAGLVLALIDALEEAREKVEILEAEIRVMRKLPSAIDAILNEIPAAAPPVGDDTHAAAQTGEDHYDATQHVIGEHARDWIERNRS